MQLPKIAPPDVIDPADPNTSAAGPANAVTVADVRVSYGRNLIFDGISLSVPAGSIIGIVGPSGCGKSTLLSLIAGLLEPDQGSIDRVSHPGRHPLSMMFQRDTLLPWLTAADIVRLFTRFR